MPILTTMHCAIYNLLKFNQGYCPLAQSSWNQQNKHLHSYSQKQSSRGVLQERCSQKFRQIHRKATVPKSFFNKVAGLRQFYLWQICGKCFFFCCSLNDSEWFLIVFKQIPILRFIYLQYKSELMKKLMRNLAGASSDESTILILCLFEWPPTQFVLPFDQLSHDGLKFFCPYFLLIERKFR